MTPFLHYPLPSPPDNRPPNERHRPRFLKSGHGNMTTGPGQHPRGRYIYHELLPQKENTIANTLKPWKPMGVILLENMELELNAYEQTSQILYLTIWVSFYVWRLGFQENKQLLRKSKLMFPDQKKRKEVHENIDCAPPGGSKGRVVFKSHTICWNVRALKTCKMVS